jgi:tetratricopeptide (TPR) repeat protein
MSKKRDIEAKGDQRLENIEESLTRSEQFILKNQKYIGGVIVLVAIGILGYFAYQKYYIEPKEKEAQGQMYVAQRYFEADSLDKAIYGDGNALGFLDIADEFSMTKSGNLANYYVGISFLKKGDYGQAIDFLSEFKADDHFVGPMATAAIGDAYMQLDEKDKAVTFYMQATDQNDNDLTSPLFLKKAGETYELLGKYDEAIKAYTRIEEKYPRSNEARTIEKNIGRAQALKERK